ncbi:LysR family transcriptional regulator [Pelomonas sp. KK5]|uniref:LysR family transcriptional regulator n=1 Tax=Pelomonas sp. KK5 TaxID=1855730 RepID=UPI00097C09DB|nr:LysR family transcriptional regulator [Pelomonas sp. KK5]
MARFDDLAAFAAVVRAGSFTRAAAQLGITQSALSQTIRALEQRLDLKLLNRTTRSVSPTEAGERLFQAVGPRFEDIEAELAVLGELRGKPAGTVRISASEQAMRLLVWPRLQRCLVDYPDIRLELSSNNSFIDIVAERFDIGIRIGSDVAKDMIAVPIAPDMQMAVVASPAYFTRRPPPQQPQALTQHDCIGLRLASHGGLMKWEFMRRRKSVNAHIEGRLVFNSSELVLAAALAGHGLAWLPLESVRPHLAAGRLVSALDDWAASFAGYHAYYPSRRASPAVKLVVEALRTG